VAKSVIPDPLTRRHLVERELPAEKALAIAEAYLAENRTCEALDFLRLAGAKERLAELRSEAVSSGDAFLFRAAAGAMETAPERQEWRRLAEAAQANGRERDAEQAGRQAERGEG
jgi:hypothetical protein